MRKSQIRLATRRTAAHGIRTKAFIDVEELCVFAADYIWPRGAMTNEELMIVVRPKDNSDDAWRDELHQRNRSLSEHKRLDKLLVWRGEFLSKREQRQLDLVKP